MFERKEFTHRFFELEKTDGRKSDSFVKKAVAPVALLSCDSLTVAHRDESNSLSQLLFKGSVSRDF